MNLAILSVIVALGTSSPQVLVPDLGLNALDLLTTHVSFSPTSLSPGDTLLVVAHVKNATGADNADILLRPRLVVRVNGGASSDATIEEQVTSVGISSMPLAVAEVASGTLQSAEARGVSWFVLPADGSLRLECRVPWQEIVVEQRPATVDLDVCLELDGRDRSGQPMGQQLPLVRISLTVE